MKTSISRTIAALVSFHFLLFSACFYDVDRSKIPDDDAGLSGLGEPCSKDAQCDTDEADYCAVDVSTGQGACTVKDCLNNGCPTEYQCCDCTEVGYPSFCVENDDVEQLAGICPCS